MNYEIHLVIGIFLTRNWATLHTHCRCSTMCSKPKVTVCSSYSNSFVSKRIASHSENRNFMLKVSDINID